MSRLWPERLFAGVFPEGGWLRRRSGLELGRVIHPDNYADNAVGTLQALLAQYGKLRHAHVELLVSDRYARVVHLPWQAGLANDAQRSAFGRACFEQAGLDLDGDWLVHAAYRHFSSAGIAYALPRILVEQVRDALEVHGSRLGAIMPLAGATYWRYGKGLGRERSLVLIEECTRVSALQFEASRYAGLQIHPAGEVRGNAITRLLHTIDATFPEVRQVQYWSTSEGHLHDQLIAECLPQARIDRLDAMRWC